MMCAPLSRSDQFSLLIRSKQVETALAVTGVALAALAALQFFGVIGGPAILRLISFFAVPASLSLAVYCFYRIFNDRELLAYGLILEDHSEARGDCLFENTLPQISVDGVTTHVELRRRTVEYMRGDLPNFGALEEAYLEKIATPREWCTHTEVFALALLTGQPLLVIDQNKKTKFENIDSMLNPIFLYLQNGNHFVMCKPLPGLQPRDVFDNIRRASEEMPAS